MACCGDCEKGKACSGMRVYKQNINTKHVRNETKDGSEFIVVPVVMMVEGAHYNGGLVTQVEFVPQAWNGRPVTLGHPEKDGAYQSANTPEMEAQFTVGKLYNAGVSGGKLKAEAWIELRKLKSMGRDDVINMLADKDNEMNVSTGYFCDSYEESGEFGGKKYIEIHRNIKPDHLALLPDEDGACNFADGCGVRVNRQGGARLKVNQAIEVLTRFIKNQSNEPTEDKMDEEKAKIIAELIASEKTPFANEDEESLNAMEGDLLKKILESYKPSPESNEEEQKVENIAEDKKENPNANAALSVEDRAALAFARNQYADHRKGLVAKITANSNMREADLFKMDVSALEVISHGLRGHDADFSGRGFATNFLDSGSEDESIKAMRTKTLHEILGGE